MRWGIALGLVLCAEALCGSEVRAEWQQAFRSPADSKMHSVLPDAMHAERMLVGIEGGVLETRDRGVTWKRSLTVPSHQPVHVLYQEAGTARRWAATPRSLYFSLDAGKKWEPGAYFLDGDERITAFLAEGPSLYVGHSAGLSVSEDDGASWTEVREFAGRPVFQIERSDDGRIWIASERGIYRSASPSSWEAMYRRVTLNRFESDADDVPAPADTEDPDASAGPASALYFWFGPEQTLQIADGVRLFRRETGSGEIRSAGMLPEPLMTAPRGWGEGGVRAALGTRRSVELWESSRQDRSELAAGWPSGDVRFLTYDPSEDRLIAVTSSGVYRYEHPELNGYLETRLQSSGLKSQVLLDQFEHEPGILELQQAAMRYAEVHPEKIIAWRQAAAKRAWLPSLGVGHDAGTDQTVDIDRGGTADLDRFIQGPDERDEQWSVDVSWDLADLIWSTDQTTIDNRSKLMVQLRDDLLTQLNHLYYSRRRLQIEGLIQSSSSLQKEIDRRLQIDEYTAGIDALTGGYFSRGLGQTVRVDRGPEWS